VEIESVALGVYGSLSLCWFCGKPGPVEAIAMLA
jgi:hypothetical protein